MKFSSLEALIGQYHEVRAKIHSARTTMPSPEALRADVMVSNPERGREVAEVRKAFIADVQGYFKRINWCDMYVLVGRLRPSGERKLSWNKIIRIIRMNAEGRHIPYHYRDYSDMSKRYRNYIYPEAEKYFREVGYLR